MPPSISGRDLSIVQLVARFRQMSSAQIHSLLFSELASHTPCDRALRRLVSDGYLHRIERRMVGGAKGGSGQYVYSLGRRGFFMHFEGRYSPARSVNYHSIAIGDCWVSVRKLERDGVLAVHGMSTEPDCWQTIGRTELHPDMYLEVARGAQKLMMWLEVDMGTEGQKQLRRKLEGYVRAWEDAEGWAEWPLCLWVVVDDERVTELRWLIEQLPRESQSLFAVCSQDGFAQYLS